MRFELTTLRVLDRTLYPLSWMIILHEIDANLPCQKNVGGPEFVQGCREYAWV